MQYQCLPPLFSSEPSGPCSSTTILVNHSLFLASGVGLAQLRYTMQLMKAMLVIIFSITSVSSVCFTTDTVLPVKKTSEQKILKIQPYTEVRLYLTNSI